MFRMPRSSRRELVREAQNAARVRQARQVPGYKGRWRIALSQVVGILLFAAIIGVGLLLWLSNLR
jgi:hypothetical protein